MKVVWSLEAESSFNAIIDFLLARWTVKEASTFIDVVENTIEKIVEHPIMFKISQYNRQSREALITKHTTMFYRIFDETIEIEYFWGNFQNPATMKEFLKS